MVARKKKSARKLGYTKQKTNHFCSFQKGYKMRKVLKIQPEQEEELSSKQNLT
ncbi:hypothetical protein [Pontibacter sp. HJ8]